VGIGGMLAATNSTVAEVTSKSSRGLATALYVIGYPLGGVIGGYVAQSWLLVDYDWRAVFMFGAVVTGMMIPIVVLLVPETPAFHATRRKPDALARVNRSLLMLRQPTIGALSVVSADFKPKISDILVQPGLRKITWILTFSYMLHSVTLYYILKFTAQIVADAGFSQPEAAGALMWTNIGGIAGGLLFGFVLKRWSIKKSTVGALLLTVCGVAWFGRGHDSLAAWQSAGFMAMFFLNAGVTGCYSAFARCFQTYVRATGTGFALGLGRLGAAVSPILAGFLFVVLGNQQLFAVSVIMALGSLAGAILLWLLPLDDLSQ
jgi:MFS family permease